MKSDGKRGSLPPGVRLSKDQGSAPITSAEVLDSGAFLLKAPEMLGIQCQIQHPMRPGEQPVYREGILGAGVMLSPDGPRVVVEMKHVDGTSLMAILTMEDFVGFGEIYAQLPEQALLASRKPEGKG